MEIKDQPDEDGGISSQVPSIEQLVGKALEVKTLAI
jgi:hypothetical protein